MDSNNKFYKEPCLASGEFYIPQSSRLSQYVFSNPAAKTCQRNKHFPTSLSRLGRLLACLARMTHVSRTVRQQYATRLILSATGDCTVSLWTRKN